MRTLRLALAAAATLSCVTGPRGVHAGRAEPGFQLPTLVGQRTAVWPVPSLTLDAEFVPLVTEGFGSKDAFLDAVGEQFSARLVRGVGAASLTSKEVVALLADSAATRPLLDSANAIGSAEGSRFDDHSAGLQALCRAPALKGLRYAVLLRPLALAWMARRPSLGTPHWGSQDEARASLGVAVVDLVSCAVVWEGTSTASKLITATLLSELVDDLSTGIVEQVTGKPEQRRWNASRCEAGRCEGRGICIDGLCL